MISSFPARNYPLFPLSREAVSLLSRSSLCASPPPFYFLRQRSVPFSVLTTYFFQSFIPDLVLWAACKDRVGVVRQLSNLFSQEWILKAEPPIPSLLFHSARCISRLLVLFSLCFSGHLIILLLIFF